MRKLFLLLVSFISMLFRTALGSDNETELTALRTLPLDNGLVESVEFFQDSTQKHGDQVYQGLPPRVIVKIRLHPAPTSNIRVEIWLPVAERWNGRFLGLGNGGSAGNINPGGLASSCRGGYAAATTDMGTSPNDQSGVGNPEVWKDFGYRATHLMTVVAKQVITVYYGRQPEFSYFSGGSTGGQQALQEAQRYPDDYDGIVASVPAHCRTPLHAYFLWNYQILQRCPFTPEQEKNIIAAGNDFKAQYEPPQTAGSVVSDPRCTNEDIEAVIALACQKDPSLTENHVEAMRKLFQGPRHAVTGEIIFGGVPFGATFLNAAGHRYLFDWAFAGKKKHEDINFAEDIDTYTATLGPYLNAENTDLQAFKKRGGKLIMISGSADPIVPYHATLDYYERTIEHFNSLEEVQSFFLYYIVPGRDHGSSGPGVNSMPNLLDLVINWRENGIAPTGLEGKRFIKNMLNYRIPIYPYPTQVVYDPEYRTFKTIKGRSDGVDRVAERYSPAAAGE